MSEMVERVARALAKRHGDNWDDIPDHKGHWVKQRGQFGGRFRDVNERFRCDYLDEAEAAIEAMQTGWQPIETAPKDGTPILAFHPADGFSALSSVDVIWWEGGEDNCWLLAGDPLIDPPTHWQPLPAPPVEAKSEVVG